jgi:hypothetical protein
MYLYLDESGDLGFDPAKKGRSKKFVITVLACRSEAARRSIRRAVRHTLDCFSGSGDNIAPRELKGTKTSMEVKKHFYERIHSHDWTLFALILDKGRMTVDLHGGHDKNKLYNHLSHLLMEKVALLMRTPVEPVNLIVDRSKNQYEIREFNEYLGGRLQAQLPRGVPLHIHHIDSAASFALQAADMFCFGIFRKYEFDDPEWYMVFQSKIKYEREYK